MTLAQRIARADAWRRAAQDGIVVVVWGYTPEDGGPKSDTEARWWLTFFTRRLERAGWVLNALCSRLARA